MKDIIKQNTKNTDNLLIITSCNIVKCLWTQLDNYFSDDFRLPSLTPQTALFGIFSNISLAENASLLNHLLLIFKLYHHYLKLSPNLHYIIATIRIVKILKKRIASVSDTKSKNLQKETECFL